MSLTHDRKNIKCLFTEDDWKVWEELEQKKKDRLEKRRNSPTFRLRKQKERGKPQKIDNKELKIFQDFIFSCNLILDPNYPWIKSHPQRMYNRCYAWFCPRNTLIKNTYCEYHRRIIPPSNFRDFMELIENDTSGRS